MTFRVPYLICLHRLSAALHRRGQAARKAKAQFRLRWLRLGGDGRIQARWYARRPLTAEAGDPVADHRNVLVALWAAKRLGLTDGATLRYARDVLIADRAEPGWGDVVRKVVGDLKRAGLNACQREVEDQVVRAQTRVMRTLLPAR